ncbi:hypothetical protein [Methanosarcina sp.]|uniref:hypothetical protein n=1 Tax=Methanosarcina sp. TaxID=2213 RepID=UPI002AB8255E|nr:hypothetical protein [Methanosarcina sp.]MDY9926812.1 hypothetical protein [Methanosarcina sp.]
MINALFSTKRDFRLINAIPEFYRDILYTRFFCSIIYQSIYFIQQRLVNIAVLE